MELFLDKRKKYKLKNDAYCWWIDELVAANQNNRQAKKSERWVNCTGYHGRLDQLLEVFLEKRQLGANEIKDIKELIIETKTIREEIREFAMPLQKTFTEKRKGIAVARTIRNADKNE